MIALSPRSLEEAIEHLAEHPELRPVAGCTDLMVAEPGTLRSLPGVIDLLSIPELEGIRWVGETLEIGATTTFTEIGGTDLAPGTRELVDGADRLIIDKPVRDVLPLESWALQWEGERLAVYRRR